MVATLGGLPLQLIVEAILSILAMVFLLVDGIPASSQLVLLTIFVTIYLVFIVIWILVRSAGAISAATLECIFGVLLLLANIAAVSGGGSGLAVAGCIMNIFLGALFMVFYFMENGFK